MVTTCWSCAWSNRTSPSKWVGLGSPLAACSVYGDLACCVHTVNNLCMFNCQCHFYLCNRGPYVRLAFVPNMLSSWIKDIFIIIITKWVHEPLWISRLMVIHWPAKSLRFNIFKHVFLETDRPIKAKFEMKPPLGRGTNVYSNDQGHMTNMAAMPIFGKNINKSSSLELKSWCPWKF